MFITDKQLSEFTKRCERNFVDIFTSLKEEAEENLMSRVEITCEPHRSGSTVYADPRSDYLDTPAVTIFESFKSQLPLLTEFYGETR